MQVIYWGYTGGDTVIKTLAFDDSTACHFG